ncbi:hypothetical protein B0T22DRAFT_68169 [Podospora appendiculata]|uniref:Uncharacterized protein n=1 Tax=Podospora appendiculata TaxID=314037 RepID=A0AAE0XIY1_9PEZI|nr:hypothetical protein B0T22DRAFT_68169 [Podospora appendiculata]
MGLLDDTASVLSFRTSHSKRSKSHRSSSHRHKDRSRSKSRSPSRSRHRSQAGVGTGMFSGIAASVFGGGDDDDDDDHHQQHRDHGHREHKKHHDSSASRGIFNHGNASRSSFFSGFGGGGRSPSYYKRSPRPNFVSRVLRQLKRLLRDLVYYAKRHPVKVFMLVLMPLITGGALTALLARFGLKLPAAVQRMMGLAGKAATGDSIGLVGEAVRMASGGLGNGVNHSQVSIERGRSGGVQWERRSVEKEGAGWGASLKGIAKMLS